MSSPRVTRELSLAALLWSVLLSLVTAQSSLSLDRSILRFVPRCATTCFRSFVNVNYDTSDCGRSPSLQCLCARFGASGATLGEGAFQCISAQISIDTCDNDESDGKSASRYTGRIESQWLTIGYRSCHSARILDVQWPATSGTAQQRHRHGHHDISPRWHWCRHISTTKPTYSYFADYGLSN